MMIWVERPLSDVRRGDVIRLPGRPDTQRLVITIVRQGWHVRPGTGTGKYNPPVKRDWVLTKIRFAEAHGTFDFREPDMPIEIELTSGELAAIELFGWANRN